MHIGKRIVKNNKAIYETVIDRINNMLDGSETKQIVLFGAGSGGVNTYHFLAASGFEKIIKCFVDNNPLKHGSTICGRSVLSCDDAFMNYGGEIILISCGEGDEIIRQIQKYNIPREKIYIPDISAIDETDPVFIRSHLRLLNGLYESLGDDKSRDVLAGILNYKMTHDMQYIEKIADAAADQYFDSSIIKYDANDIFLDCGAYIGDTAEEYIRHNGGKYKKIICLEADPDNCNIIMSKAETMRMNLINAACWSEPVTLTFDKIGSGSGTVLIEERPKSETISVRGDTIDHIVGNEKISFIKMDIEGAEYEALIGARHVIERDKPTLMISVYHKQNDLIRLPMLIRSVYYDYTFYLRHYRSMSIQETVLYAVAPDRDLNGKV